MSFALQLQEFAEKAKANAAQVVQKVALDLTYSVIDRSPVGNQELWAANQHAMYGRQMHNAFAQAYNLDIQSNPNNFTKGGKLKRGVKLARSKSARALKTAFPLQSGKGYVGGRFRGNWQVSIGHPMEQPIERVDGQGGATKAAAVQIVQGFELGAGSIWIMNNLPYGPRLEYEAWSTQAPAGMVRVSMAEVQTYINHAISELDK